VFDCVLVDDISILEWVLSSPLSNYFMGNWGRIFLHFFFYNVFSTVGTEQIVWEIWCLLSNVNTVFSDMKM